MHDTCHLFEYFALVVCSLPDKETRTNKTCFLLLGGSKFSGKEIYVGITLVYNKYHNRVTYSGIWEPKRKGHLAGHGSAHL